jgi:general secretion pathway protein B
MSYILDALRKAEADRKLGETAGVHDPAPVSPADAPSQHAGLQRWLPGVAVGLLLGLTGTLAWMLMGGSDDKATSTLPRPEPAPLVTVTPEMSQAGMPDETVVQLPRATPTPNRAKSAGSTSSASANALETPSQETAPKKLTPEVRATLPPLAVGGAMYSDVPASRMVVINGQLYREGDTVAPGITLELIQLKSAILRHQGQRYILDY